MYNRLKQLSYGFLLLLCISLTVSVYAFDITVINDPSSRPAGRYSLTLEINVDQTFTEPIVIFVNLGPTNMDCNYFSQANLPSGSITHCETSEEMIKLHTNTSDASQIKLVFEQVEYSSAMIAKTVFVKVESQSQSVEETGINIEDWIPQQFAEFTNFIMIPDSNILTCQPFNLTISGTPHTTIKNGSKVEITFDPDVDTSACTTENLLDLQKSSGVISGLTTQDYSSSDLFLIQFAGIKGFSLARDLIATLTIYTLIDSDSNKIHSATRKFLVSPEIFSVSGAVSLLDNKIICKKGKYALQVTPRCAPIPNAVYEIITPFESFGDQYVKIASNENLTQTKTIEFEFTNPCLAIPGTVLSAEEFIISVYNGDTNNIAFTFKSELTTDTSYEPGLIKNFEVKPDTRAIGVECFYTFKMRNSHSIPKGGRITLTIDPYTSFTETMETTVNGVEAEMLRNDGVFTVKVPMYISALTDIKIIIGEFKNPSKNSDESEISVSFHATSYNAKDYKIDESESVEVLIDEPELAEATYAMSSEINFVNSSYFFTLKFKSTKINEGDILGISIPIEIDVSTCTVEEAVAGIEGEDFDFWISVKSLITDFTTDSLPFIVNCRNPGTTAQTSSFEMGLFNSKGKKIARSKESIVTTQGSEFDSATSSIKCDKTCPQCKAMCTIVLGRINTARFRTIEIYSPILYLKDLACFYDESGQSFLSTCTTFKKDSEEHIKVTLSISRAVSSIVISNIGITYPDYDDTPALFYITTYASEDIDAKTIIESDNSITLKGACNYPCKSCSQDNPNFCYTCTKDELDGQKYYLYPEGTQDCAAPSILNCRLLEKVQDKEVCCTGYYKNEVSHQCLKCGEGCIDCKDEEPYCHLCMSPGYYLINRQCKTTCDEGTYKNPNVNVCESCSEGCRECASETECSACYKGYNFYEEGKKCVKECPAGTYLGDNLCKACHSNCVTCYETSIKCTGCKDNTYLLGDKCVDRETCEEEEYVADDDLNTCEPCSSLCVECGRSATFCTKCKPDEFLNEEKGTCLTTCAPHGYNVPSTDGTHGICAPCENNCKLCLSDTKCLTCQSDYVFHTATEECVPSCPDGFYEYEKKCYPCNSHCEICDSLSTCSKCLKGRILYKGQCYQRNCPEGTFNSSSVCEECDSSCAACSSKYSCTKCVPSLYKNGDKCVSSCPEGTTLIGSICESCSSSCSTCEGTKNSCTSCSDNKYLYRGECINNCPTSTTIDITSSNVCVSCVVGCKECAWDSVNDLYPKLCISCLSGYKLLDSSCYTVCPDGYVSNSDSTLCIDIATARNEEILSSKSNYVIFPHILVATFLSAVLIKLTNNKRSFVNANLLIILNFVAISSYISTLGTASSDYKTEIILVTGAVLILQIILNLLFLTIFMRFAANDSDFNTWGKLHCRAKYFILTVSSLFSFQNIRLLYSRVLDLDMFFVKFKDLPNFFRLLNWYSLLQLVLVQGVIIVFDAVELVRLPYRTMNYIFMIESFVISSLLVLSLYYETKNTGVLSSELRREIIAELRNNQSISSQSISGGSNIEEKFPTTKQKMKTPGDCDCEKNNSPDHQHLRKENPMENRKNGYQVYSSDGLKNNFINFRNSKNVPNDSNLKSIAQGSQEQSKGIELPGVAHRSSAPMNKRSDSDSSQKYAIGTKNFWNKISIAAVENNEASAEQPIDLDISKDKSHNFYADLGKGIPGIAHKNSFVIKLQENASKEKVDGQ